MDERSARLADQRSGFRAGNERTDARPASRFTVVEKRGPEAEIVERSAPRDS
jgi:hypothetical protein